MSSTLPQDKETADKKSPVPLAKLPGVLFNHRWWWSTLVVIAGMLFLGRLGLWQLDRLEQRRAENAAFEAQFYSEQVDLNGEAVPADPEMLVDRQAMVDGRFDYENQIILMVQNYGGRPGVHLVTPLLIEGKEQAILVDRGWIPAEEVAQGNLERFDEAAERPVTGILQSSQSLSGGRETIFEAGQREWYRIDIEAIQTQSEYNLLPVYLLQAPTEENPTTLPIREPVELDLTEGNHLSYAIQWFLFALILGVGYVGYVRSHNNHEF
jgi:surfeit locus 1 family protein